MKLARTREYRRWKYQSNPDLYKRKALEWYYANPEKVLVARQAYKSRNRKHLSEMQLARYYSDPALKHRAALRRERDREKLRAKFRAKRAALTDVYVRDQLAKHSTLSMKDIPPELVEVKRLQLQLKQLIEQKEQAV